MADHVKTNSSFFIFSFDAKLLWVRNEWSKDEWKTTIEEYDEEYPQVMDEFLIFKYFICRTEEKREEDRDGARLAKNHQPE